LTLARLAGRREVLKSLLGVATMAPLVPAAEALSIPGPPPGVASGPSRAVVAIGRRNGLCSQIGGVVDKAILADALGASVARAASESEPVRALRKLFRPRDVVGIKVNCIAGRGLSSRPETALLLSKWLQEAGIPAGQIVIWDRTSRELKGAGFELSGSGVKVAGTDGDWSEKLTEWGPSASRFSRLLVENVTAVINLGVLKDHGLAGISAGMKNWYGVIHNPNKLHAEGCNPFVPYLAANSLIRDRLRLTIVDGTTAQYHNGPGYAPSWAWPYQGFLTSTDPVAVDAVAWRVIEEKRKEMGLKPLAAEEREPKYIAAAGRLGLGVAEGPRLEVVSA
jgi:uncharacterized protein (DUF362 family)